MTFPFGFSADFHGFHFRSIYFPIVCVVIAVYMTIGLSRALTAGWGVAGVALLFSSLPMFYHFERVEKIFSPGHWGMVDTFQAGIAALAAAAFMRSLSKASQRWLSLGSVLASFTLLIKPSGFMVMALLGVSWFMLAMWKWWIALRNPDPLYVERRYVLYGVLQIVIIFVFFFILCVTSEYLSPANFAYARQALAVMKVVLAIPISSMPTLIHSSIGDVAIIWILAIIALYGCNPYCQSDENVYCTPEKYSYLIMAFLVWVGGAWYWLVVQSGGNQIRYFFPFAFIGIIYLVPMAVQVWQHAKVRVRVMIMVICILPAVNMACLLLQQNPPVPWQKVMGVNVSIGTSSEEEGQAYAFLEKLRKGDRNAYVYSFQSMLAGVAFANVGRYAAIIQPEYPTFITKLQADWTEGFVTRLGDLLSSEYILFRPVKDDGVRQTLLQVQDIDSFELENQVFQAWLSGLTEKNGVQVVSESRVRLLEIINGVQLKRDVEQFVAARSWHAAFNKENPHRYWRASEAASYIRTALEEEIQFGDLYKLHALMIKHEADGLKIEIWWEELKHEDNNNQRVMFFHLIDAQGKIFRNQHVELNYDIIHPDRRWRYDSITYALPIDPNVKALAIGIYHPPPQTGYLKADKGTRDWGGRRVVVPLTAAK